MLRLVVAIAFLLAGIASADACSISYFEPSPGPPPPPPTPEEVAASLPEVVLEGVVIRRDPISGEPGATDDYFKQARMHVYTVWKGEAAEFITLRFSEPGGMCEAVPPVGERIRIWPAPVSPNVFAYDLLSGGGPGDPSDDAGLRLYRERTLAIQRKAETGGRAEKLAFADYLHRNGERHRAIWMYESFLQDDPDDFDSLFALTNLQLETYRENDAMAGLDHLRELSERKDEWRGKVARFEFEATGRLTAAWKDWSGAKSDKPCRILGTDFDEANFDGAVLAGCSFGPQSTFRGASFKGADLGGVSFALGIDFRNAEYDCATQFRKDVDPVAEGMINVEGSCAEP